jgi:hypothetical protein
MTVLDRQRLREDITIKELQKAHQRAREVGLSITCVMGMSSHGEEAAWRHGECKGEEPGNRGCLCLCHDDNRGGVESGTAVEMETDTTEES